MKNFAVMLVFCFLVLPVSALAQEAAPEAAAPGGEVADAPQEPAAAEQAGALDSQKQKVSYCIGLNIGRSFQQGGIDIDIDVLVKGMSDALAGSKPLLTDEQIRETMTKFQEEMMMRRQAEMIRLAQKNEADGKAFLEENKQKPGVVTLPSGLQYEVMSDGEGESPAADDTVTVNYRGTLVDGTEFDSSDSRGGPAKFTAKGVIAGWTEALQLMNVGSKWRLFIPSELAYREAGRPPRIGPNSALIFEIELLSVEKAGAPAATEPEAPDSGGEE